MKLARLVTLGDSTLDSKRYSGGPGTSAPELLARERGAALHHLARDGHTANATLTFQLPELPERAPDTALVVSVGGNDLLTAIYKPTRAVHDFTTQLEQVLARAIERLRPERTVVANIYDPTGHDPSLTKWIVDSARAMRLLGEFNDAIAGAARAQGATLVDLCAAFRASSGATPPWIVNRIEPSREGAKAIARLLGEAFDHASFG